MSKDLLPAAKISKAGIPVITTPKGDEVAVFTTPFSVKIIHPGSVARAQELEPYMGKFYFQEIEMSTNELYIVPIKEVSLARTLFPLNYDGSASSTEPLCRSLDGFVPDSRIETPQSMRCAMVDPETGMINILCDKAKWIDNKPSQCKMSKNLLFFDANIKIPFYWQLKGVTLSAYNKAIKQWEKQVNICRFRGITTDNLVFKVTLKNKGTYYEPIFEYTTLDSVSDLADVVQYYKILFSDSSKEVQEDIDTSIASIEADTNSVSEDIQESDGVTDTTAGDASEDVDEVSIVENAANKKSKKKDAGVDFDVD